MSQGNITGWPDPELQTGQPLLERVCRWAALLGGLMLCGLAIMLVVTIVSRKLFFWQVNGDYEIVQMLGALATSLLFPWCHLTSGNIAVDIFTDNLPRAARNFLEGLGSLLLAVLAALLAWRTGVLAVENEASGLISAVLGWPVWMFQASLIPGLFLTAFVAVYVAFWRSAQPIAAGGS